jgi:hypothetical protein
MKIFSIPAVVVCVAFVHIVAAERCQGVEYYVVPDGRDYRGTVNVTAEGIPCQKWSSQFPHAHDTLYPDPSLGIGDNNYCRNPFGDATAGCFTTDPNIKYQECDIGPACSATPPATINSLEFSIPNGTSVPSGTFLCISCSEQCDLYYTIDGTEPSLTSGTLYEHCVALTAPIVHVRVVAYLVDGSVLVRDHVYYALEKQTIGSFFPLPGNYASPVLLFVRGADNAVVVADIFQSNSATPLRVGDAGLWVSSSGYFAAVINQSLAAMGFYNFSIPNPQPPAVFPSSGTFFGGVNLLLYPLPRMEALYVSFNNSALSLVTLQTISLSSVGTTTMFLKALYLDGTTSNASFIFTIFEEPIAVCTPPPGQYTHAVNVTCTSPRGAATIIPNWLSSNSSALYVLLSSPGTYNLTVTFSDDAGTPRLNLFNYTLQAQRLAPPQLSPCGGSFAFLAAFVRVSVAPHATFTLQTTNGSGTVINDGSEVLVSTDSVSDVTLTAIAALNDDMALPSLPITCTFSFYGSGVASTETFRSVFVVNITTLAFCLSVANQSVIRASQLGDSFLTFVSDVPDVLQSDYSNRLQHCLTEQGHVSNDFSAVVAYTMSPKQTVVGSPVRVEVSGLQLQRSVIKMVQDTMPCDDVGALLQWNDNANGSTFTATSAGSFRLCAISPGSGRAYGVPGAILVATVESLRAIVVPCGGAVAATTQIQVNARDGTLSSMNGGAWHSEVSYVIDVDDLPIVISAVNGDSFVRCLFYAPSTTVPENATYHATPLGGHVSLTISGFVQSSSPLTMTIQDGVCLHNGINTSIMIPTTVVSAGVIVPDEDIASQLPVNPVVCLSNSEWTTQLSAIGTPLSRQFLDLMVCAACDAGYCFLNHSCACSSHDDSFTLCPEAPLNIATQDDASSPTWVRAMMIIVYAAALIAVWIVFRTSKS